MFIVLGVVLASLTLAVVLFFITYKVVDPNEAHIVVFMGRGRRVYAPKFKDSKEDIFEGKKVKTAYFFVPGLMTKVVLPLTNVKMDIREIHLNDENVAPFVCDVISWIRVNNPIMAAERLDISNPKDIFGPVLDDLINIVQATARAAAMHQEVLGIMKNRKPFAEQVGAQVKEVLVKFGIELVNLEVNDIKDDEEKGSNVIGDYESIRKVEVNTKARKQIALKDREAVEVEQENKRMARVATAFSDEESQKKEIDRDRNVGIARENQQKDVATAQEAANSQKVEAARTLNVGGAQVQKEATIEKATGEGEAIRIQGEKEANVIQLKGEATGKAIEAKGTAEAVAKDRMAEAMKKYNESATGIEKIRAWIEIQKAKYEALGTALSNADLKLVSSGKGGNLFGFDLNAESGADLKQMLEAMEGKDEEGKPTNPVTSVTDAIKNIAGKFGGNK